jgi:catechol 2,3-dioxygenase-like lactoylglutathione lyase family enzyme
MIKQLHHVNVTVPRELETATKKFYGSVLGLQELPKPEGTRPSGAWYQIGPVQLHLSIEDETDQRLSTRHVCYTVDDIVGAEDDFRRAGVEVISDPRPIPGRPRVYLRDPGGNLIEIVERRAKN